MQAGYMQAGNQAKLEETAMEQSERINGERVPQPIGLIYKDPTRITILPHRQYRWGGSKHVILAWGYEIHADWHIGKLRYRT